jgi:hypothetical protein
LVEDRDVNSIRPLLLAVMQGLSKKVGAYEVKFPRVLLAHVAMESPVKTVDPNRANDEMRARLSTYRDRDALITLLGNLLKSSLGALMPPVPGSEALAESVAQAIVDPLRRAPLLARVSWDDALPWFKHQDNGRGYDDGISALVQLSRQAAIDTQDVREDVDNLLVAALLADVRESLARVAGRPWNAVVLLDEGDVPTARSFVAALVRRWSRSNRSHGGAAPYPLVVVAATGGQLAGDLPGHDEHRPSWLPVVLGGLTEEDVRDMALARLWPSHLGTSRVAEVTYRLTDGHAAATDAVLHALEAAHDLVDHVDDVLDRPGSAARQKLGEELLDRVVKGLGPRDRVVMDLVTLSAARDRGEAARLANALGTSFGLELMTSTTLWSDQTLPRFVRYLGLRALARRADDDGPGWVEVFTALRDDAARADDDTGRLHHELSLGRTAVVAEELTALLPVLGAGEWLERLDDITATPNLSRPLAVPAVEDRDVVHRLLVTTHALKDPRLSARDALCNRYLNAENDLRSLAGSSEAFLLRAREYRRLADRLS